MRQKLPLPEGEADILQGMDDRRRKGHCVPTRCIIRTTVNIFCNSYRFPYGTWKNEHTNKLKGKITFKFKYMHRKNSMQKEGQQNVQEWCRIFESLKEVVWKTWNILKSHLGFDYDASNHDHKYRSFSTFFGAMLTKHPWIFLLEMITLMQKREQGKPMWHNRYSDLEK